MDKLLNPNFGVLALTVVNFLLLVWLLHKFAWKSLIGALESREQKIAEDLSAAAEAREAAQSAQKELDAKLRQITAEASKKMQEAVAIGNAQKDELLAAAREQSAQLLAQAQAQIAAEKERALKEVRDQVAQTAVLAAAQLWRTQATPQAADAAVEEALAQIAAQTPRA